MEEKRMGILINLFDIITDKIKSCENSLSVDEIIDILTDIRNDLEPSFLALTDGDVKYLESMIRGE